MKPACSLITTLQIIHGHNLLDRKLIQGKFSILSRAGFAEILTPVRSSASRALHLAVVNHIGGLLLERGITLRKGRRHADAALRRILKDTGLEFCICCAHN